MLLQAFFDSSQIKTDGNLLPKCLLRTEFSQILQVQQGHTLDVLVFWGLLIVIGNAL